MKDKAVAGGEGRGLCLADASSPSSWGAWGQESWWQESCGKCGVAALTIPDVLACSLKRHFPVYPKSGGFPGRREAAEAAQQ